MEFKPGAESDRHPVVRIAKAIRRAVRLLIIGEEDSLPKPEKPRRVDGPDFAVDSIQGEEPPILKAFYILYGDELYQRAIKQRPPRR